MKLTHHKIDRVDVAALEGRLTAAEAGGARQDLARLIETGDARLVLDLSELTFCDSSGLSVLISGLKAARAKGGEVVLAGPTPPVRALIELTRLHQVFAIYDDAASAAAGLG
ncbi:STAS domain-containing protein [Thiococcus pfennigii]|uniref:STAS domain-containing protein n=1 Tax=Thiococcus pfennigii TaxID=1057 RepID=UPI001907A32A|nr:STAS domain-containing protein [Thiococcus pfennigii]MBK1699969.1 anti-anti-sigma factor [Thiococcus pfennigii]